jgi:hypothetical protein
VHKGQAVGAGRRQSARWHQQAGVPEGFPPRHAPVPSPPPPTPTHPPPPPPTPTPPPTPPTPPHPHPTPTPHPHPQPHTHPTPTPLSHQFQDILIAEELRDPAADAEVLRRMVRSQQAKGWHATHTWEGSLTV